MNGRSHPHGLDLERAEQRIAKLCSVRSCVLYGTEAAAAGSGCQCDPQRPLPHTGLGQPQDKFLRWINNADDDVIQADFENWIYTERRPVPLEHLREVAEHG